tara:strand:+ start:83 stop:601 length:519 start_codon:yes stop_codon:yes gene_type:complete
MKNENIKTVIKTLKNYFSEEIKAGSEVFLSENNFKVRPGYGPNKFYLDRVEGSYEYSLQNLIHHMLWEDGHYESVLNTRQLKDVENIVNDEPNGIYGVAGDVDTLSDSEYEEDVVVQESIDLIYFEVIQHVGSLLEEFDFFDATDYVNMGYIEEKDDDEDFDIDPDLENLFG